MTKLPTHRAFELRISGFFRHYGLGISHYTTSMSVAGAPSRLPRQGLLPFQQRGMRMVKSAVDGMRREIAQILLVQLAQRANQGLRPAHHPRSEGVGLIFITPRPPMDQRRKPERNRPRQQSKQQQRRGNVSRFKTERAVKPFLPGQDGKEIKTGERAGRREGQHFRDVLFLEVTDFVREHRFQLRPGQLLDQRVKQHDFPEPPEAGEKCVRMPRTFAAVHQLDALGAKLGSPRQLKQPFAQVAFRQRREFVEQRQNQNRREHAHQELKCQHRAPSPQPPPYPRPLDNFQDEHQQRIAEGHREQQTFQPVGPPDFRRRGVEPELFLQPEL